MESSFRSASTFEDLLQLNIDFIEGKIDSTPYHRQPYNQTGEKKNNLIETNRLGFLTLGGQCAEDTPTLEKKLFLDGYIKPELVRNFIKYLKRYPKIEYYIEFLSTKQVKTNIRNWKNIYNFQENQSLYYNSLARVKQGSGWKDIESIPFRDLSYVTLKYWDGFPNILKILQNYAFVHIQHRSFHDLNNDLYDIINGYLRSDQKQYKKRKEKQDNNQFGKSLKTKKNTSLNELISDLKKCNSSQTNSFGTKKKHKKKSILDDTLQHLSKHKLSYAALLGNAVVLTFLKNKVSNALNKKSKKKNELRREQRARQILREEIKAAHDLYTVPYINQLKSKRKLN